MVDGEGGDGKERGGGGEGGEGKRKGRYRNKKVGKGSGVEGFCMIITRNVVVLVGMWEGVGGEGRMRGFFSVPGLIMVRLSTFPTVAQNMNTIHLEVVTNNNLQISYRKLISSSAVCNLTCTSNFHCKKTKTKNDVSLTRYVARWIENQLHVARSPA